MIVDKNSWHFKIYSLYTVARKSLTNLDKFSNFSMSENYKEHCSYQEPTNFCAYWRHVLLYPVITLFFNLLLILIIISLAIYFPTTFLWVGGGIVALLTFLFALASIFYGIDKAKEKISEMVDDENSFVGNVYTTYHDKICTKMEYKND